MNYHAWDIVLEQFMKRAFLIMSAALSCSGLAGCSWMSKDPCSAEDADLSNPACVVQSKQTYRDNNSRWFCIGHLEAKDWSCASSLKEAQTKHDALSKAIAQAGRGSTEVDPLESAFDLESASAKRVNLPNPRSEQGGLQPNAKPDEGHHVATVIKKFASEATVLAEVTPTVADVKLAVGDFETGQAAQKISNKIDKKQSIKSKIKNHDTKLNVTETLANAAVLPSICCDLGG